MNGILLPKLPRWIINSLRRRPDYDYMWLIGIQVSSQEFGAGYETVSLLTTPNKAMQLRRVTGRSYADRAIMCCTECQRTTQQLAKVDIHNQHLRACGCVSCRLLLCVHCRVHHEAIHELAGEKMVNPWSRAEVTEHKIREETK